MKTNEERVEPETLAQRILTTDARYKLFQAIFFVLIVVGLLVTLIIQQRTLNTAHQTLAGVQNQLNQQKTIVQSIKTNDDQGIDKLNRHIDCILAYFSLQNRQSLTITDVNKCTISSTTTPQQFYLNPDGSTTSKPNTNGAQ